MTTLEQATAVAAVVVAYRSAATLDACLEALRAVPEVAELLVVDNAPGDGSGAIARRHAGLDARVRVLEQAGNPGFAAGCNAGAAATRSPWLLFVNPDLELPADAVARLQAHAATLARPGALGADLRDATGRRDPAARRRDLTLARLLAAAGRRGALDVAVDETRALQPVEAASGALLLVPRTAFDAVGGWDAGYRLHVEDLDFCRRLREAGFAVAVAGDVAVLHHRGVSSRSRPWFVEWHKHRGLWRYWWRFEARGAAAWLAPLVLAVLVARLLLVAAPVAWRARG